MWNGPMAMRLRPGILLALLAGPVGAEPAADCAGLVGLVEAATGSSLTAPPAAMELSGTSAERIRQVLEGQINPSIASHGGRADLVRFDEATGTVELRLSGGCQGCAQSTATLRNGIEGALRAAVPEINEVVDVTDHAGGETPYY